jgi:hypothetical protein
MNFLQKLKTMLFRESESERKIRLRDEEILKLAEALKKIRKEKK